MSMPLWGGESKFRGVSVTARNHSLFRKEVFEHRAEKLHGDVSIATPVAWHAVAYLLFAALVGVTIFLSVGSYARVETVAGAVVLDRGVASVVPTRSGTILDVPVREGTRVARGDTLVKVRSDEDMAGGVTVADRMRDAMHEQDRSLAAQTQMVRGAAAAERSRLAAQAAGLSEELASLDSQIEDQRRLVAVAQREFDSTAAVATGGFVSRRELDARESALLSRRQELARLQQSQSAKRAQLADAQRSVAQAGASAEAQAAGVHSSRAELLQRLAQTEASSGYSLTAPVAGIATAVTARPGQPAQQGQPLMVIMPEHALTRADLYVPTQAAGFLAVGQEVRLAVDAFPYQRFGTVAGRIEEISSVATPRGSGEGGAVPVYLVTVSVPDPAVTAFGRRQPLLPGMTLSARIVTEERSLFHWLFEPLFAVARR